MYVLIEQYMYIKLAHLPCGLECLPMVRGTWVQSQVASY